MATPTLDQLITEAEQWFHDTMHNSVVAREVAVYNHVHSAFEDLKGRIAVLFTGKARAPQPAAAEGSAAVEEDAAPSDPKAKSPA